MSKLSEAPASSLPGAGQVRMCKCCGAPARCFGTVDFSKSCLDYRGKVFADSGQRVTYYRCEACGFLFTTHIDDWGAERIAAEIYNAEYVRVDPDFSESRPRSNAQLLSTAFGAVHDSLSVLDYGGGDGLMAGLLCGHGFDAQSYDPYHLPNSRPRRRFQLVTAFEVVEHAPDPLATLLEIHSLTEPAGAFLFTTLVQPANLNEVGLDWWYAGPRNGHVSLHTRESLRLIAQRVGWTVESSTTTCMLPGLDALRGSNFLISLWPPSERRRNNARAKPGRPWRGALPLRAPARLACTNAATACCSG